MNMVAAFTEVRCFRDWPECSVFISDSNRLNATIWKPDLSRRSVYGVYALNIPEVAYMLYPFFCKVKN